MKPYNPLEKENLGKSVADSLSEQDPLPLAAIKRFPGAGIYAIYYTGNFELYLNFRTWNHAEGDLQVPIYVGKAIPKGGRKGIIYPNVSAKGSDLFSRLEEHRKSIIQTENLRIEDFWCRYLVVDNIWIPLGESLLIQRHRPIWNAVIDGFGNHDPGRGRHAGARPTWDTLHPGRSWATKCAQSTLSEEQIRRHVAEYWGRYKGPNASVSPPTG